MTVKDQTVVRRVRDNDRPQISKLLSNGTYVHRHLDWRSPEEWIGYQPYWVLAFENQIKAALACPSDLDGVAWIRLFALKPGLLVPATWDPLWAAVQRDFADRPVDIVAIPTHRWFQEFLCAVGFFHQNNVVTLDWVPPIRMPSTRSKDIRLRPMERADLKPVQRLDKAAFTRFWQISLDLLETAWSLAATATVAEDHNGIVGYQISTASYSGGHLARLAVHPDHQGQGFGRNLLGEMFTQFERWGTARITVNTQADNIASLALYEKVGFRRTGEEFPVYQAKEF